MRILHLTDLHVGKAGEATYGVDVRRNLDAVLQDLPRYAPDLVMISGDLCYRTGETKIYKWIRERLDSVPYSFAFLSGNHDDPQKLADVFNLRDDLHQSELYYSRRIHGQTILFLDTTAGTLSEQQLQWTEQQLRTHQGPLLFFMHHPPFQAGVPFMDQNYPMHATDKFCQLLFDYPYPIYIFCGHYHVEKTIARKNVQLYITPSLFFQIDQSSPEFKVDHYRIGFRLIERLSIRVRTAISIFMEMIFIYWVIGFFL
jgi:Icc protein